jgi:hypothetical protein
MYSDNSGVKGERIIDGKLVEECNCPPTDLILAPEDAIVAAHYKPHNPQ